MKVIHHLIYPIVFLICSINTNKLVAQNLHKFTNNTYTPIYNDDCLIRSGLLTISEVTDNQVSVVIDVQNYEYTGNLECKADIIDENNAVYSFNEYGDEMSATWYFKLLLSKDQIEVRCEGSCMQFSGVGVCMNGVYERVE